MTCRHYLANGTCTVCYPETGCYDPETRWFSQPLASVFASGPGAVPAVAGLEARLDATPTAFRYQRLADAREPVLTEADREALRVLAERLQTQHNDYTAHPVFLVQRQVEYAGFSTEYTDDIQWLDDEGNAADSEEHARLEAVYEEDGDAEPEGWTRTGVLKRWETVQSFLTRAAAEQYRESNAHNLGTSRIYTDSAYRNHETQLLQRALPLLVGMLQMLKHAGAGEHDVLALVELYNKAEAAMFAQSQRVAELEAKVAELETQMELVDWTFRSGASEAKP